MSEYRELYGSGQEVEVKRATHDGYLWVPARVISDDGKTVRLSISADGVEGTASPDIVRKTGEDKR